MNNFSSTFINRTLLQKPIVHIGLIIVLGFLAYSNTFNVSFHFDDNSNIVENYKIRDLSNFWPPLGSRWFGYLTFAINYRFGGLNAIGYHIFNFAVHISNALLVYWLVLLTFKTPFLQVSVVSVSANNQPNHTNPSTFQPFNYSSLFIALFSALLFVCHPIQTQAVTYISQRFASLVTMFYLLSVVMYIKWRLSSLRNNHPTPPLAKGGEGGFALHATRYTLYIVSLISAILAMKTKEISFTLPFIIVLYEVFFFSSPKSRLRTPNSKRSLYLLPFLFTLIIIPLSLFGPELGLYDPERDAGEKLRQLQLKDVTTLPRREYLLTQFRVIVTYIRLLFAPINQNLDYNYPIYHSFFEPNVFLPFLFLSTILGLGIYLFHRSLISHHVFRFIALGIFWFFVTLLVESSIIPITDVIFEHRVYLPSVGVIMAFVSAVFYILQITVRRSHHLISKGSRFPLTIVYSLLSAAVIVLSIVTYQRNIVWQDEVNLWEDVVKKSPNKARGYNNLGNAYLGRGWTDRAIELCQIAIKIKPDFPEAHYNLGNAYREKGWTERAIAHYQIAVKIKPDFGQAYNNLGLVYYEKGLFDIALHYYRIALQLHPNFPEKIYYNLGILFKEKGWLDKTIEYFQIALKLNPGYIEVYSKLGLVYESKGLWDEAIKQYHIALRLNPNDKEAKNNLNRILRTKN